METIRIFSLLGRPLSDKTYIKIMYFLLLRKKLYLKSPKTFNEKLQWLKIYDHNPKYTKMVDKYKAKEYVASIIGEEHIIPTLGVWDSFNDINFDSLPNSFVLKCTHDSGGLYICKNKETLDTNSARKQINSSLNRNYYWQAREWPYKNVKPRILAEEYMSDNSEDQNTEDGLTDYKFFCFNGEPKFLYLSKGLENHTTAHISFVTMNWEIAKYERSDYTPFRVLPPKPECFDEMISYCRKLSEGLPFLRVDLYQINGKVFFSELTFTPNSGFVPFRKDEYDYELGTLIKIPV